VERTASAVGKPSDKTYEPDHRLVPHAPLKKTGRSFAFFPAIPVVAISRASS